MPANSRLFLYEQLDDGSFDTHLVHVGDEHHDGYEHTRMTGPHLSPLRWNSVA